MGKVMERKGRGDHDELDGMEHILSLFLASSACAPVKIFLCVDVFAAHQWQVQSSDMLAARLAVMIKTKAFSISSSSPEHPSIQIVFPSKGHHGNS